MYVIAVGNFVVGPFTSLLDAQIAKSRLYQEDPRSFFEIKDLVSPERILSTKYNHIIKSS